MGRTVLTTVLVMAAALSLPLAGESSATGDAHTPDVYYSVSLQDLKIVEGTLPSPDGWLPWYLREVVAPYVVLKGPGEAYVIPDGTASRIARETLAVRAPKNHTVRGSLYLPTPAPTEMCKVVFEIPLERAAASNRSAFFTAKRTHYQSLLDRGVPGAAWFRHQVRQARHALGEEDAIPAEGSQRQLWRRQRENELLDTYDLFSGGRAMSENLQLDRVLAVREGGEETIDVKTLAGITINAMDWNALIAGKTPQLDVLARAIPADQHALFFPSFQAMIDLMDEADAQGTPVLQLMETRAEDARTKERYQEQLCLSVSELARLLGPKVVQSVAMTGSDPYLRTGSDVAILFEAKEPVLLRTFLAAKQQAALDAGADVQRVQGDVGGVHYTGVVSPRRTVCSYMASFDRIVVVSNSLYQLNRIAETVSHTTQALHDLPEFTFFRIRYPLDASSRSAFLVLTDAAIRRWCGPQWRIGTSRRTRAAAIMAELQAARQDALASGTVAEGPVETDLRLPDGDGMTMTAHGMFSTRYNTLDFMTPVAELGVTTVTQEEADAYRTWRNMYQGYWRRYFDPIALEVRLDGDRLEGDMTVMPLIGGTDYEQFMETSRGVKLKPGAGDVHDALLHFVMALNITSPPMRQISGMASALASKLGAEPFGWIDENIAIYLDRDPFWEEALEAESPEKFMDENWRRLPLAVRIASKSPLKLAAFLTSVRAFAEQAAPGLISWETGTHKDQPYVRIRPADGNSGIPEDFVLCYVAAPDALTLSLNEDVIRRVLDRRIAPVSAQEAPPAPLLGESASACICSEGIRILAMLSRDAYRRQTQRSAWGNIPVLNELRARYPDQDPVALYARLWQVRLICPGGGAYRWNEAWQTMESTVYGHPGRQQPGPDVPGALGGVRRLDAGLTFEDDGLRARVAITRHTAAGSH